MLKLLIERLIAQDKVYCQACCRNGADRGEGTKVRLESIAMFYCVALSFGMIRPVFFDPNYSDNLLSRAQ